tara:strand:+ start:648 stop:1433 length:786 start_codon:yes stop_codon:yes gene_type:complete
MSFDYKKHYSEKTLEVVFDTETTGLGSNSSILSIGWAFAVKKDYENPNHGIVSVYSGSFTVKPDMERLKLQDVDEVEEALRINSINFDDIENHQVPHWEATEHLLNQIYKAKLDAGLYVGSKQKIRFTAYNQSFDSNMIKSLPFSNLILDNLTDGIVDDNDLGNRYSCIMQRHSEYKYEKGWGTRWSKLVDAFNTHFGNLKELSFKWCKQDGTELKMTKMESVEIQLGAHDPEIDCLMACVVNHHLNTNAWNKENGQELKV